MLIKTDDLLSGKHGKTGHFVRFYDDSDTLLDEVESFVERALRARGRGIVIATGAHTDALRRRLDEEGSHFRQLLDEVRQALAEELLATGGLTLEEIAERLGYGEVSNFIHAFKRWKGVAPRRFQRGA